MGGILFLNIFLFPLALIVPAVILYFVIKLAVKNGIRELKNEGDL